MACEQKLLYFSTYAVSMCLMNAAYGVFVGFIFFDVCKYDNSISWSLYDSLS
jgi:hypothetical protein